MSIAENLKKARTNARYSQTQMAELLKIKPRTYASYERGEREINAAFLKSFCTALKISSSDILDIEKPEPGIIDITPLKKKKYPLLGVVACGEPTMCEINEYFDFDDIDADFALKCRGDSMINANIHDGDIVLIKRCEIVDNGEIAAVAVDWDGECTLKKVYYDREKNRLTLLPCNPAYEPIIIDGAELDGVRILGRAVGFFHKM